MKLLLHFMFLMVFSGCVIAHDTNVPKHIYRAEPMLIINESWPHRDDFFELNCLPEMNDCIKKATLLCSVMNAKLGRSKVSYKVTGRIFKLDGKDVYLGFLLYDVFCE